ncbi:hypothetical protein [Aurantiacibacter marinus]|uniref:Uncharacterized protein n=2 Tax=Aurantiacibacter marinus TaxID=874156 RepID=A0A0H0XXF9_9SPHN|nr:hypothetical protein [Aurantiacibacter marinus]KLI64975.1 hypothetical protein AAV99_05675 [Aurantiacibacter marinus]
MEAIVPVLVGGLLTLAGALVAPFFQRKHEKWRAEREDSQLIREKAAELFDELDRMVAESHSANIAVFRNLAEKNVPPSPLPDLGRIRMLVGIYFPEAMPTVEGYEERCAVVSSSVTKDLDGALKSSDGGDRIKALTAVMVSSQNEETRKFVRNLRAEVAQNIPRLK